MIYLLYLLFYKSKNNLHFWITQEKFFNLKCDWDNHIFTISKNINGIFCLVFFDYNLFFEDIDSSSNTYKQCIQTEINQFNDIIDKTSYIYLLSSLRYAHSECDNIMYINITDSYVINHYECAINSTRVKEIFLKYGFKILNEYNVDIFPFLDKSQISYTPNIEVIEFSNNNEF